MNFHSSFKSWDVKSLHNIILSLLFSFAVALSGYSDSVERLPLQSYLGRLRTVTVSFKNQSYPFLFDTGAGLTVVTPEVARGIACKPYGRIVASRMDGQTIEFQNCGTTTLTLGRQSFPVEISVLDLMSLLPKEAPPIGGIVSLHTFQNRLITLDLHQNLLIIETKQSFQQRQKHAIEVPLRIARPAAGAVLDAFVGVRGLQGPFWFEVDSANLDDVLVSSHAWNEYSETEKEQAQISLTLIGLPPGTVAARKKNLIYDGALNAEFLEKYLFSFDLSAGRLWVQSALVSQ
jgi:hypothetical protein